MTLREAARLMNAARHQPKAGPGRPRKVKHNAKAKRCLCVECRKARGHYPDTSSSTALSA